MMSYDEWVCVEPEYIILNNVETLWVHKLEIYKNKPDILLPFYVINAWAFNTFSTYFNATHHEIKIANAAWMC